MIYLLKPGKVILSFGIPYTLTFSLLYLGYGAWSGLTTAGMLHAVFGVATFAGFVFWLFSAPASATGRLGVASASVVYILSGIIELLDQCIEPNCTLQMPTLLFLVGTVIGLGALGFVVVASVLRENDL